LFEEDDVAVNRAIAFKIETFEPTESFNPTKPYKTQLKWRDASGADQSKLLVTPPETVIGEILTMKSSCQTGQTRRAASGPRPPAWRRYLGWYGS
jgi:hypothetical protein